MPPLGNPHQNTVITFSTEQVALLSQRVFEELGDMYNFIRQIGSTVQKRNRKNLTLGSKANYMLHKDINSLTASRANSVHIQSSPRQ